MKKLIAIVITLTSIASSYAAIESTVSETGSPLASATPSQLSETSAVYKQVVDGREAAVNVIGGEEPSELFEKASIAAMELTGENFESDLDAAIAIIELSQN